MTTSLGAVEAATGVAVSRREVEISFVAVPSAVPQARHFTARVLRDWRLDHLVEVVELLSSELVTNTIKTSDIDASDGREQIRLRLAVHADRLFLIVWDNDTRPPVMRDAPPDAESGRGLFLVETLSERWGHRPFSEAERSFGANSASHTQNLRRTYRFASRRRYRPETST